MSESTTSATRVRRISEVDEFCKALGGNRPIHSILIANNGMAAVKFIYSVRRWCNETFGTDKAIYLLAMATPEDLRINAEHIRIADQFIQVPAGTSDYNYANVHLIVEIAETTHVDAVWPGWGHASEDPELPNTLGAKGIIFLGPQAASMAALGDKIGSSLMAQAAQVPTLPWSGSHVKIPPESSFVAIPEKFYKEACVQTTEEAIVSCQVVGYPAMIKASWGGGGKGIRKVHNNEEVKASFKQVEGEVPGSPIFIMKVASQSRHLEVQLLCDEYGNVAAFHSRDCSVQRRHQKIIEEGPITVAPLETLKKLELAARRLAKTVNYVGAATVEFLYSMKTGEYYFLELNPRLQVEHPITEWIADINLVAAQVAIGMGIPLWQIPEIRRFYGMEHGGGGYNGWRKTCISATPFDFDNTKSTRPKGHCVAVRVTSENPDDGFKPTSGRVEEVSFISKPNVWAYFSVKSVGGIHEFSDSQFGHVFAFGESRAIAIANMVLGLKNIQIRGEIRTNVDYSIDLLNALDFKENKFHTEWLDSRIEARVRAERVPWYLSVVGGALYKASACSRAAISEYVDYLEKGQIPPKHISLVGSQVSLNIEGIKYVIHMVRRGLGSYRLRLNDSEIEAELHTLCDGGLLIQLDGNSHVIYTEEEATGTQLLIDGKSCLLQNDHDPSKLLVETPCKLLRWLVVDGSHVDAETPYAEVEVMKMCMPLLSHASGIIHFQMSEGRAMKAGELIARFDLDDPSTVRTAEPFRGSFPVLKPPIAISGKVHQQYAASLNAARMILAGYEHNIDQVVQNLLGCLDNSELPFLQWQECFAVLAKRLPKDLRYELEAKIREFEGIDNIRSVDFPAKNLCSVLEAHLNSCLEKEKMAKERLVEPLMSLAKSYEHGIEGYACSVVQSLFEDYLSVEEIFNDNIQTDVIESLRLQYKDDLLKIVGIVLSHQGVKSKNKLMLTLMERLVCRNPTAYIDQLIRVSTLNLTNYYQLKLNASQLLEQAKFNELRSCIVKHLLESKIFTKEGENMNTPKRKTATNGEIEDLENAHLAIEDVLISLLDHDDQALQQQVVETYVHRLYQPYLVKGSVKIHQHISGLIASWEFLDETVNRKNRLEDEILNELSIEKQNVRKWGAMVVIKSLHLLPIMVDVVVMKATQNLQAGISSGNVMHVVLIGINKPKSLLKDRDEDLAQENMNRFTKFIQDKEVSSNLRDARIKIVSCIIQRDQDRCDPMRHSFHWLEEKRYYEEQPLLRHLEPPLSKYLELEKLKHYENIKYTSSCDRLWHIYTITDKMFPIQRMFLRTLVRQPILNEDLKAFGQGQTKSLRTLSFTSESIMRVLMSGLEELERINAHISANMYLCILQEQQIDHLLFDQEKVDIHVSSEEVAVEKILDKLAREINASIGVKMHHLGVSEWEVKLWILSKGVANGAWRVLVTDVTGHTCIVHIYREVEDSNKNGVFYSSTSRQGPLHGMPIDAKYKPLEVLDKKRLLARKCNTTYCYDFPLVFEAALHKSWTEHPQIIKPNDKVLFKVTELILADKHGTWGTPLVSVERQPGLNDIGMVAWRMEISTPEFPLGRTILIVSNDITCKYGSFGPKEYVFFKAVTDLACAQKVPLIYLAANSGVHIELAEDVKSCFKVGWSDETNLECGFQYIYLTAEDYARIGNSVIAHEVMFPGEESRWVIDTILTKNGFQDSSGTGAIASAFSKAYRETFTLTYVAGLNIGLGAYLARIGSRCIQRLDHPILLTGFSALNKLLGREVYSSNIQLGGPKIMSANGVVHLTVTDDLEGISAILKWLSFVPAYIGGPLPIMSQLDPIARPIEYLPKSSCDPCATISGVVDSTGKWLGGMFDKDSFMETLAGWARTIVTGRARLGGIPVGVIAVETQTMMQVFPADPGQLDSCERVVPQAGQLWHSDSATKTAQALLDFNQEKLPLFVLANWRGFSGGQRDLFEGILQAGATIVDNLRTYEQPIFIFIPMMGEIQGGAWLINNSNINLEHIEIYAERTAKGFILEPEGLVEIKFRKKDLLECMGRLDPKLINLKSILVEVQNSGGPVMVEHITCQVKARENELLPLYTQIAMKFAELHCTSLNMVAKRVVKETIDWPNSRSFFYRKLYRRTVEDELIKTLRNVVGHQLEYGYARNKIREWFLNSEIIGGNESSWTDDEAFFKWIADARNYDEKIQTLRVQKLQLKLSTLRDSTMDLQALPQALAALLKETDPSIKDVLKDELRKVLNG